MSEPIFIGICGGSGSGKTYLLDHLKSRFNLDCSVCSLDDYYKQKEHQEKDANGVINFDLPTALNTKKLEQDLNTLKNGESIFQKEYHFNTDKAPNIKEIKSAAIIIVEGLFVFEYDFVRALLDYSIYVKVDEKINTLEAKQILIEPALRSRQFVSKKINIKKGNNIHQTKKKKEVDVIELQTEGF